MDLALAAGSVAVCSGLAIAAGWLNLPLREPTAMFGVVGSALFGAAGLCGLLRWWLVGDARAAYSGLALLLFGSVALPVSLALLLLGGSHAEVWRPGQSLLRAVVLLLFLRAARGPAVDSGLRPAVGFAGFLAAAVGVELLLGLLPGSASAVSGTGGRLVTEGVLAVAAAGVGVLLVRTGVQRGRALLSRTGVAVLLLAVASMVAFWHTAVAPALPELPALAGAVRVAGGLFALMAMGLDLDAALTSTSRVGRRAHPVPAWLSPALDQMLAYLDRHARNASRAADVS